MRRCGLVAGALVILGLWFRGHVPVEAPELGLGRLDDAVSRLVRVRGAVRLAGCPAPLALLGGAVGGGGGGGRLVAAALALRSGLGLLEGRKRRNVGARVRERVGGGTHRSGVGIHRSGVGIHRSG
eukprot:959103-Prorocentrum_minimum.AAC.1